MRCLAVSQRRRRRAGAGRRHGTRPDRNRRDRLGAFAERFVAAGTAAFVFDYRGFGDSTGEPDLFEVERQLDDWRAAIAFARTLPGIDADRVGTFGSSFCGGHALAAAAEGRRVAAVISQVPLLDRDSQTYTGHPEVNRRIVAVAADGDHLFDGSLPECWLLARWPPGQPEPTGYRLSNLPVDIRYGNWSGSSSCAGAANTTTANSKTVSARERAAPGHRLGDRGAAPGPMAP